jgi:peptidoglycan/xylan/chitin deacetylase (PgdA/CDA1 family)
MGRSSPFWPERVVVLWRAAEKAKGGTRKIQAWMASSMNIQILSSEDRDAEETIDSLIESLKTFRPTERERLIGQLGEFAAAGCPAADPQPADATFTWKDLERMDKAGVTFGSHTQTHQILPTIARDLAQTELVDSKQEIQHWLRKRCVLFAYPNGDWSPDVRDLVSQAGYKLGFTTQLGGWKRDCDSLLIPRVTVSEEMLVGPLGRFSRAAFEYAAFWKVYRAKGSSAQDKGLIASSSARHENSISGRRNQIAAGVL